jgi:hypothetical protein
VGLGRSSTYRWALAVRLVPVSSPSLFSDSCAAEGWNGSAKLGSFVRAPRASHHRLKPSPPDSDLLSATHVVRRFVPANRARPGTESARKSQVWPTASASRSPTSPAEILAARPGSDLAPPGYKSGPLLPLFTMLGVRSGENWSARGELRIMSSSSRDGWLRDSLWHRNGTGNLLTTGIGSCAAQFLAGPAAPPCIVLLVWTALSAPSFPVRIPRTDLPMRLRRVAPGRFGNRVLVRRDRVARRRAPPTRGLGAVMRRSGRKTSS